jgi:hypothetical protein
LHRRRTQSPTSPTPVQRPQSPSPLIHNRPRRTVQPRHFFGDTPTPPPAPLKLCSRHPHVKPLADFIDENTGEELDTCNNCRNDMQFYRQRIAGLEVLIQAGERLVQQHEERMRLQVMRLIEGNQPPPVDYLDQIALTGNESELLRDFQNALSSVRMEECSYCHEKWFDMNVNEDGICRRCTKENNTRIFDESNHLDPGMNIQELAALHGLKVPEPLSQVEEIMISPVHSSRLLDLLIIRYKS